MTGRPQAVALPPPPVGGRVLGPGGALALATAAWVGALAARPLTLLVPVALAGGAALARRPAVLVLAAGLAASALAARAADGLDLPPAGPVHGSATLVGDPERRWGASEVVARLAGRHVQLRADGAAGEVIGARLAGDRVVVTGRWAALPAGGVDRLRARHVVARVRVDRAEPGADAAPPWRAANHLRRLLVDGARSLDADGRALYAGLVLGDDRAQRPEVVDDFRGSGLAHLLAVSGQNVAFVLAGLAPALRSLGRRGRLLAVVLVLGLFATATRFEPSVLRAVGMAGVAAVAAARGRPTPGLHLLGLAVAALILVDPFLVRSLAFRLSVAATAGILVVGPHLMAVLPGPVPLTAPVAVSAAAQLGVAPLLVAAFDGVPVASLPANVLAAPAAALVMTWGLPAGLVAGLVGEPWASWLHRPTGLALDWLAAVARVAASVPLGELAAPHLVALAGALGLAVAAPAVLRRRPRLRAGARAVAGAVVAVALAAPAVALAHPPLWSEPVAGVEVRRVGGATVVVIAPGTGPARTLEGLRRAGVTTVDVLVVGPGATAGDEERAARHRARVHRVWHPGPDPPG